MCIDMALTAFKWIHAVKKRVTQPMLWNGLPQVAYNSLLVQVRAKIPQSYTQQNEDYGSKWSLYFFLSALQLHSYESEQNQNTFIMFAQICINF